MDPFIIGTAAFGYAALGAMAFGFVADRTIGGPRLAAFRTRIGRDATYFVALLTALVWPLLAVLGLARVISWMPALAWQGASMLGRGARDTVLILLLKRDPQQEERAAALPIAKVVDRG